jgi:hypothetical protein
VPCAESAAHGIGRISVGAKRAGKRSAGKPPAPFDVAGVGDGFTAGLLRHSQRKRGATDRPSLRNTAPALDPTEGSLRDRSGTRTARNRGAGSLGLPKRLPAGLVGNHAYHLGRTTSSRPAAPAAVAAVRMGQMDRAVVPPAAAAAVGDPAHPGPLPAATAALDAAANRLRLVGRSAGVLR